MPPSGYSPKAVAGALIFTKTTYEDLLAEVRSGKHETVEAAIEFEIGQIDKALTSLHINEKGEIAERK